MKKLYSILLLILLVSIPIRTASVHIDTMSTANYVANIVNDVETIEDVYSALDFIPSNDSYKIDMFETVANHFKSSNLTFKDTIKQSFIDSIFSSKHIQLALVEQDLYNIPASVTLAQAFIESKSYRKFELSNFATVTNNYFGIKYHQNELIDTLHTVFTEEELTKAQLEKIKRHYTVLYNIEDRVRIRLEQNFAKFEGDDAVEKAFRTHSLILLRYNIKGTTYQEWTAGLVKNNYATDSNYSRILNTIIKKYNLGVLDYYKS